MTHPYLRQALEQYSRLNPRDIPDAVWYRGHGVMVNGLRPGDIMFGPIGGAAGNLVVGPAQLLLAAAEPGLIWRQGWREWYGIRHVGVMITRTKLVQAMPRGAEVIELTERHWTLDYVYIRPAYAPCQGVLVAEAACSFIGTPYNFATYAAIPAHRAHIPVPHLDRYISSRNHMMCSQLADQALSDADWHVFDDGRLSQDVTPSELFRKMLTDPTDLIIRPNVRPL